jgi:hypothetical protein
MRQAKREDVETPEAIVKALYEVISGPAGPRDWERERTLLAPGARLMPVRPLPDGTAAIDVFDTDAYIASRGPFLATTAFDENEVSHRIERFGAIAHVWSTYETRHAPGEEPFLRGINSIQLFHDGDRWWVMSIFWDNERPGNPWTVATAGAAGAQTGTGHSLGG